MFVLRFPNFLSDGLATVPHRRRGAKQVDCTWLIATHVAQLVRVPGNAGGRRFESCHENFVQVIGHNSAIDVRSVL